MKGNTMCYYESKNEYDQVKIIFRASYKDPLTKKYKQIVRSFDVPDEIYTKTRKYKEFRLECENLVIKDKEQILNKYSDDNYLHEQAKKIVFCDYAKKYIDDMLIRNPMAYHYHTDCLSHLKVLENHFQKLTLSEITHKVVRDFCDWLRTRTYTKYKVVCKKLIKPIIKDKKMTLEYVSKSCNISISTLDEASKIGATIEYETAKKLCNFLNIKINEYYNITETICEFSKSANNKVRWLLSSILGNAVKEGYISVNYASSDYISPMTGTKNNRILILRAFQGKI